ncbi:hypothetical protein R3P38DRAFT_2788280 [Favolaschia claudopus]|uniref:Uncharacterized protein n=1 Tax=Favolaschia claudopus TaxID=2862362 RepID=A0AAW0ALI6_9AGAR
MNILIWNYPIRKVIHTSCEFEPSKDFRARLEASRTVPSGWFGVRKYGRIGRTVYDSLRQKRKSVFEMALRRLQPFFLGQNSNEIQVVLDSLAGRQSPSVYVQPNARFLFSPKNPVEFTSASRFAT